MKQILLPIAMLALAGTCVRGGSIPVPEPSPVSAAAPDTTQLDDAPTPDLPARSPLPAELLMFTESPAPLPELRATPASEAAEPAVTSTPEPRTLSLAFVGFALALAAFALSRLRRA